MAEPDFQGLKNSAVQKAEGLTSAVSSDPRWNLQDELLCQVFGFTLFGYVFGYGRTICFMEVEEIQQLAAKQLTGLGVGAKYAQGMMEAAMDEFASGNNQSLHSQLIGIGHSHLASEDTTELVDSIFQNADQIRAAMQG